MKRIALAYISLLLLPAITTAEPAPNTAPTFHTARYISKARQLTQHTDLRGWDHLFLRLLDYGVDADEFAAVFQDKRMPRFEGLQFSVKPREPHSIYRGANAPTRNTRAMKFFQENAAHFERAEQLYGVPQSIVLAIIQMETNCGSFTGKSGTLYGLARLAAASDPKNIERVYQQIRKSDKTITKEAVAARAQYLEDTFLPHVASTLQVARDMGIHPLELKGSHSGAIGLPQFLPDSVIRFGVDGDGNGNVNLFSPADAIFSTANFLSNHGWKQDTKTVSAQRAIIWNYNRSEPYIDSVIEISNTLRPRMVAIRTAKKEQSH